MTTTLDAVLNLVRENTSGELGTNEEENRPVMHAVLDAMAAVDREASKVTGDRVLSEPRFAANNDVRNLLWRDCKWAGYVRPTHELVLARTLVHEGDIPSYEAEVERLAVVALVPIKRVVEEGPST